MERKLGSQGSRAPGDTDGPKEGISAGHLGRRRSLLSGEKGTSLVETLVAVVIVAVAVVPFLTAFSTGSLAVLRADRRATAEHLARSQMEYAKSQAYVAAPASYGIITPVPAGYSISADATSIDGRDASIQKITVTVEHDGEALLTLKGSKLDR